MRSTSSPVTPPTASSPNYSRARAASDQAISEVDLDFTGTTWLGDVVTFRWAILHMIEETRWAILHMIEETGRHAGHGGLIREHIDGTTGYMPPSDPRH